jgi:hypothetical protein
MRRIIIVIVALLTVTFVVFSFAELQNIAAVLQKSNLYFLLVAFLFEALCLYNSAATFGALYRLVGLDEERWQLFLMTTAAAFINTIAPSGGVGGIAVFVDAAKRRHTSTARVLVVGVLYVLYEYLALFVVLGLGFTVLIRRHSLNSAEVIAAIFLLGVASAIGATLVLGRKSSEVLGEILARLSQFGNRISRPLIHRDLFDIESAYQFARDIAAGIATVRGNDARLVWPLLFTLNNKALLLCVLAFTFYALGTPFSLGTLVGGFSVSYLFFYASPTPSGVGFVEGILPAALNQLGVPLTEAILITLVFRALTVWVPLLVGGMAFRILQRQRRITTINI